MDHGGSGPAAETGRGGLLAEQNRRYYEAMENQHFEIRRLKHDMTNHLQTALALPDDQRGISQRASGTYRDFPYTEYLRRLTL